MSGAGANKEQEAIGIREQSRLLNLTSDAVIVRAFGGEVLFWNRGAELFF